MSKPLATEFPLGKSEKVNVALQRPTVNLREAENVSEQMTAVNHQNPPNPLRKTGWGGGHLHNLWD
jgi:hypothetical protein